MSNVLVIVEQAGGKPKKSSLAGITFGQKAAARSGGELHLLVIGAKAEEAAALLASYDAAKVHVVTGAGFEAMVVEAYTAALAAVAEACNAKLIAGAASSTTKDVLPRFAARVGAGMASDVIEVVDASTFKRPMWAGNVIATVQITTPVKVCSVRATEFDAPAPGGAPSPVAALAVTLPAGIRTKFVAMAEVKSTRPDVTTADVVVSGGRGVKGPEGFAVIEQLADALRAGVGATRAVCDAGWTPNDLQIGQTGKIVAPNLYVAVGISGAIQHLAGMKGSKTIVAINKDPDAPIFQVADYGLVADLFTAVPELIKGLAALRG